MSIVNFIEDLTMLAKSALSKSPDPTTVCSLPLVVQQHASSTPNAIALLCDAKIISWQELNDNANRVAALLKKEGISKGDCVSLFMQNRMEFVACVLGIHKLGAIAGLINTNLGNQQLTHCISLINSKKCIFGEELTEPLNEIRHTLELKHANDYLYVNDGTNNPAPEWAIDLNPSDSTTKAANPAIVDSLTLSDKALYIFTSGTTGLPKAAVISNMRFLPIAAMSADKLLRINPSDRVYNCLPLYHGTGLTIGLAAAFHAGASTVIKRKLSVSAFWDDIRHYQCTSFVYIGEFIRYLMSRPAKDNDADNPVRTIVGNGLRPDIWQAFKKRFDIPRIGEFYAASEGNGGFANVLNKDCTVGLGVAPVKLAEYDIVKDQLVIDSNGHCIEVKEGQAGLLLIEITKDSTYEGYTSDSASKKKVVQNAFATGDQYFNSGDLMKTVEVGFAFGQKHYQFVDRVGDTFRWKSENVSTNEVAECLNNYHEIQFANIYGVQIPNTDGRAGMAAIVLNDNKPAQTLDLQALTDHIKSNLPSYARPIFIRVLENLPTTTTHKLQKNDLREHAFHLDKVDDMIFVTKPGEPCYSRLDNEFYNQIMQGKVAF
ncbi:MAG: long-chain-acyl-CoA synthetase [Pseudomonadales bacterium]|nr:long-chain-acyl-CoA synthetase [Pseudomonadales bacterium]